MRRFESLEGYGDNLSDRSSRMSTTIVWWVSGANHKDPHVFIASDDSCFKSSSKSAKPI